MLQLKPLSLRPYLLHRTIAPATEEMTGLVTAPKIITSGVIVTSNGFLLPAMKAIGRAMENASTNPHNQVHETMSDAEIEMLVAE